MKNSQERLHSLFQPTFGNRPEQYIGRDGVIEQFMAGLREPVAAAYQELVGDQKNVAIAMAGLPHAVSSVLNDKVLTFLNRATKVELELISTNLIRAYYERAFRTIGIETSDEILDRAARLTRGFPYMMQLIGYYTIQYTPEGEKITDAIMDKVEKAALGDMEDNVFKPILNPLSDNDMIFLRALARCGDTVSTAKLQNALGKRGPAIQPYRKRLIDEGVIEAPRRGELVFAVPYLAEFLLKN